MERPVRFRTRPDAASSPRAWRLALVLLVGISLAGCAGRRQPVELLAPPAPGELLNALAAASPPGDCYEASLYIEFEGGFLGDDTRKINGQLAIDAPDRARLLGAYGAFKKLFDLSVEPDSFHLFDTGARVVYVGSADDAAAAEDLGLAVNPAELPRLLRLGGTGPLTGAEVISVSRATDGRIDATFRFPDDSTRWIARYVPGSWRLEALERWNEEDLVLLVEYGRYGEIDGRAVPRKVAVTRPRGSERVRIEVRSLGFRDDPRPAAFRFSAPRDVPVQAVGRLRKALPEMP